MRFLVKHVEIKQSVFSEPVADVSILIRESQLKSDYAKLSCRSALTNMPS